MNYYKAFIRVVKSLSDNSFGSKNIVEERLIEAKDKKEVKAYLYEKYPQFFPKGKVYTRETKDEAQIFYVIIYELYAYEKRQVIDEDTSWSCAYCGQEYSDTYRYRPKMDKKLFGEKLKFCNSNNHNNKNEQEVQPYYCIDKYKELYYKDNEFPDDEFYIKENSPIYIYKCTEKQTNKCYIGKTKNAPFFRWWNHLTHSSSPFGKYLRESKLSDWTFEVLAELPHTTEGKEVLRIESEYIVKFNSIENGFNSTISNKEALNSK